MTGLQEHGALVERFAVAKPDYAVHAEITTAISAKLHDDDIAGQKSGSKESMHLSSAAASREAQDANAKEEKEAKQRTADMMLQALLDQIADLDRQIDSAKQEIVSLNAESARLQGEIEELIQLRSAIVSGQMPPEDAVNDPRLAALVEKWEEENGTVFDPDDDISPAILSELLTKQIEGHEDRIDANGRRIGELEGRAQDMAREKGRLQQGVDRIVKMQAEGASPEAIIAEAEEVSTKYEGGDLVGVDARVTADVEEIGRDSQEVHRDLETNTNEAVVSDAQNEDDFGGFGAALELASADVQSQFQTASVQPSDSESVEPRIENVHEVGMQA